MTENVEYLTPELVAELTEHRDLIFGKAGGYSPWEVLPSIEVYVLTPESVTEKEALAQSVMTGWQLLAEDEEGDAVAVLVRDDPQTGPTFEGVERGAQTDAVVHLLKTQPDLPGDATTGDTPRLLSVPVLGLRALWYPVGNDGHVIPLAPSCRPFEPFKVITKAVFESQLHPVARDMVEQHAQLGGDVG